DSLGAVENLFHLRDDVAHLLLSLMSEDEFVNHATVDRTGSIERVKRRKVLDGLRLKLPTNVLHTRRLKLKYRIRTAFRKQLHSLFVIKHHLRPRKRLAKRML